MLEIRNLKKSFNGQTVLNGINLSIPANEITIIIGGSGSGKSVLLKHIIGLLQPDEGEIFIDGVNINTLSPRGLKELRMRFGVLFQDAALFDSLSVFENIAFPLLEHRQLTRSAIEELVRQKLRQVNLEGIEEKYPSELSGGMRKRVGLARAIVLNPEIIFYDEPTTGLDPIMSRTIDNLIVKTQKTLNTTSVIISHDIRATLRIADNVAMLHDGCIKGFGSPGELAQSQDPIIRSFIGASMEVAQDRD